MNLIFFANSMLLGVGLAMDAFSVSIADALNEPGMRKKKMVGIAGTFGGFQALMPLIGWILVHTIVEYFKLFEKLIPWIGFLLLLYIGGKMIYEGIKADEEEAINERLGIRLLMVQGVATSIDALSVGFTIANYDWKMALVAAVIIAIVTFIICIVGLLIGKKVGSKITNKAQIVGGVILVGIGIEILVSSFLG